jgi:chromosome segregation protein
VHLKSLEITGFKSFADKTKLVFEPGMTAIVGPNGCGKSNVSDAIRWVLGEQSAKALRGSKMEDCIFNGTQNRKPLGMAEVHITFTNCEQVLQTDFHEVTITRRVFRSGEGQYFINKTPCRLKDVQRLFMDTGVGTSSYSFMAQGRIDQILSARPEDRREIFEEASGITKYKSDKREALRKLEHTDANLLRLADVIREVKRQIGSLQRQAGKAHRYKALREEMRVLDLYAAQNRLADFEKARRERETLVADLTSRITVAHEEVQAAEEQNVELRETILNMEREISSIMEAGVHAQGKLDRTQDLIRINTQRIVEYRSLSERDTRELDELNRQLGDRTTMLAELEEKLGAMKEQRLQAKLELDECTAAYDSHRRQIDNARRRVQQLRDESLSVDAQASRLHNQLMQIEAQERTTLIQRERLTAEKQQLGSVSEDFQQRTETLKQTLETLQDSVEEAGERCREIETRKKETLDAIRDEQQKRATVQSAIAARQATLDLLTDADEVQGDFPGGTRLLLDPVNPLDADLTALRGALAQHVSAPDMYTRALETALRPVLDALVVNQSGEARALISRIAAAQQGASRLVAIPDSIPPTLPVPDGMTALSTVVTTGDDAMHGLINRLLGNVLFVETTDQIPDPVPAGFSVVTAGGILVRDNGLHEFWMGEPGATNPLRRKHAISAARQEVTRLEQDAAVSEQYLQELHAMSLALDSQHAESRHLLDARRRELAQKEGEAQMVTREAKTAGQRLETVTWELDGILRKSGTWDEQKNTLSTQQAETRQRRESITAEIGLQNQELQQLETRHSDLQVQLTERRVSFAGTDHRVEQYAAQRESVTTRMSEIENALRGRSEGLRSYSASIEQLQREVQAAQDQLGDLETAVRTHAERAGNLRRTRSGESERLAELERMLGIARVQLEQRQEEKSKAEIQLTEVRMRRQNLCERITADYNLSIHDVMDAAEPEWGEEGKPGVEDAEVRVAELRTKLEAMGPVNLVAIEEYQEHEERYTFLSQQESDLLNAKKQLTEMIQTINLTTSEMFRVTFEKANSNFESMFSRLFNGGSAKLVLVNEEDVLDCGIEIIARPPGKRLQNISLLSGGERTLTAVALLFSIYLIKPSPFCMLDELDAPLDDTNIGRFTEVLRDFLQQSQFVVITHNRQTISTSNIIYGVTMPERGVSRIMTMKFREAEGGILTEDETQESRQEAITE